MATESTAAAATRAALRAKALRDSTWRAGAETRRVRSAKKEKNRETERERERERERDPHPWRARARERERGVEHEGSRHTRLVLSPFFFPSVSPYRTDCVGSSYLVLLCVGGGPGDDPPGGLSVQAHAARSGHSRGHHHPPPPNSHFLFLWCSCACVRPLALLCVVCGSLPSSIGAQQLGGSSTHTFTHHNIGISTLKRNTSGRDKTKSKPNREISHNTSSSVANRSMSGGKGKFPRCPTRGETDPRR